MPYRNLPWYRRPLWEQRTGLWFALFPIIGIIGLPWPSRSMSVALASGVLVLSVFWVALGIAGLVTWVSGRYRDAELTAMRGLAALMGLQGVGVLLFAGSSGAQTGVVLIAGAVAAWSWAKTRYEFGISRSTVAKAVERHRGD